MGGFNTGDGRVFLLNGLDEIPPKRGDIVAILLVVKTGFLVDDVSFTVLGVESPSIPPAHVENALGTVEIGTNGVLFRGIACVTSMLPCGGEGLKLEHGDL